MGGDLSASDSFRERSSLNPPRPHGRGQWLDCQIAGKNRLNPPRPHGRGLAIIMLDLHKCGLNPPRPHGRGQQKFTKIGSAILLPLEEMIKDI